MLFEVTHTTTYTYEAPVSQCLNEVRLTPRPLPAQQVRTSRISVAPKPAFLHQRKDYFGNSVSMFGVFERHDKLVTTAQSLVEVKPAILSPVTVDSWEEARAALEEKADDASLEASEFIYHSPYVPEIPELKQYALRTFAAGRPLVEAAKELTQRINKEFRYDTKSTSVDSPLAEVFRKKRGVCQDFAHVMIGALRSLRLSARYVSGYVRSGPKFQGAQASHAWVSLFVPGTGWMDFDPTNDMMPSETHITLALGRDYGDVTPVKGVTLGGGGQTVGVAVYVKPQPQS